VSPIEDSTLVKMSHALDCLTRYQQIIAENVANIDTPGYQARTLDFAEALRARSVGRQVLPMLRTHERHLPGADVAAPNEPTTLKRNGVLGRVDGNTVDINVEMMELLETGLKYRAVAQLAAKRLGLYRAIAMEG